MAAGVWKSQLRPQRTHWRLEGRLFREILRVGAISSVSAMQTVLTAVILTGFVARFGTAALAGYGIGVRLELLQVPIVFAIAQALVVMVGTNIGAGQAERAKKIAWTGTAASALVCLAIGWSVAAYPPARHAPIIAARQLTPSNKWQSNSRGTGRGVRPIPCERATP